MNTVGIIAVGVAVIVTANVALVGLVVVVDISGYQRGRAECASITTNGGTK